MEGDSRPVNSARPRRKRHWYIALLLVAGGVISYWALPWLLMPEDLRRLQGVWKIVKTVEEDLDIPAPDGHERISVVGSRFGDDKERYQIGLDQQAKQIRFYDPKANEYDLFGFTIRLPIALVRPSRCVWGEYELTDTQLVLSIKGEMDLVTGQIDGPDKDFKIYLERP